MKLSNNSLFDELCSKINCAYMSDLTSSALRPDISKAAHNLNLSDYDEHEWIQLAEYISINKYKCDNAKQARDYLLKLK